MSFSETNVAKKSSSPTSNALAASSATGEDASAKPRSPVKAELSFPLAAMRAALDQKALDVRGLDISRSDIADYFVICSGTSERHVRGIADRVKQELEKAGEHPVSNNGYEEGQWVILDYVDLVVHIFYEPMRQHYGLDELWRSRAREIQPTAELLQHIRMLKTGINW